MNTPEANYWNEPGSPNCCDRNRQAGFFFCHECGADLRAQSPVAPPPPPPEPPWPPAPAEPAPPAGEVGSPPSAPQGSVNANPPANAPLAEPGHPIAEHTPVAHGSGANADGSSAGGCQHAIPPGASFCPTCGRRVSEQTANTTGLVLVDVNTGSRQPLQRGRQVVGSEISNANIVLEDGYVSRQHLNLEVDGHGRVIAEDAGSSNGTLLFIRGPVEVAPGTEFILGKTLVRIEQS